jgi:hypothetical protein
VVAGGVRLMPEGFGDIGSQSPMVVGGRALWLSSAGLERSS